MYPRQFYFCPIDALPDLLYSAAYDLRSIEEDIPAECMLTDAIAACSAAVQRGYDVRGLDLRTMPTSINTAALVPSGVGKGTSFTFFFQAHNQHSLQADQEALGVQLGDKAMRHGAPEPDGSILQEVSYRGLMDYLHGSNRSATIQHEDGFSFLGSDLVNKFVDKLTQAWSGEPPLKHKAYRTDLIAVGGRCSLGFRIQPKLFYKFLKRTGNTSYHQGLWPRAIVACYDPERFQTQRIAMLPPNSYGGQATLSARLTELLIEADRRQAAGSPERQIVVLGKEAAAFMYELKYRLKQWRITEYAEIDEAAARAWENTLRLAATFHIVCIGDGAVSLEMVQRAWMIVEWSLTQHRLVFVEANRPPAKVIVAKPFKQPKLAHQQQRLNSEMQLMIDAIAIRGSQISDGKVRLAEIVMLSGFHKAQFVKVLSWLVVGGYVETDIEAAEPTVRLLPRHPAAASQW